MRLLQLCCLLLPWQALAAETKDADADAQCVRETSGLALQGVESYHSFRAANARHCFVRCSVRHAANCAAAEFRSTLGGSRGLCSLFAANSVGGGPATLVQPTGTPLVEYTTFELDTDCRMTEDEITAPPAQTSALKETSLQVAMETRSSIIRAADDPLATFGGWGAWGSCSEACGTGTQKRSRRCQSCRPAFSEVHHQFRFCNTQGCNGAASSIDQGGRSLSLDVDVPSSEGTGVYWTQWSPCSEACGGFRLRRKTCPACPAGSFDEMEESEFCAACEALPSRVPAVWALWSPWSACTATCGGGGQRLRIRSCPDPTASGSTCSGEDVGQEACRSGRDCGRWSVWTTWGACSAPCGSGQAVRARVCSSAVPGACAGAADQRMDCYRQPCPDQVPSWTSWGAWGDCSSSCGKGLAKRARDCDAGNVFLCPGPREQGRECLLDPCPAWSEWGGWSSCGRSCGEGGRKVRLRLCSGSGCGGRTTEAAICALPACPAYASWAAWSPCSASCGRGSRRRERPCFLPSGAPCGTAAETISETSSCEAGECPAEWGSWAPWSACSRSCGQGGRGRVRPCHGGMCVAADGAESEECIERRCPEWTQWSPWLDCPVSCGGGKSTRVRLCQHGLSWRECGGLTEEVVACGAQPCPSWAPWASWRECPVSCGGGTTLRSRPCLHGSVSECPGESSERVSCGLGACPDWGGWSPWSSCDQSCGAGVVVRTRLCPEGADCVGETFETDDCSEGSCAAWSGWGSWEPCSASCGTGSRRRRRACDGLGLCVGSAAEEERCLAACDEATAAAFGAWAPWTDCSKTCGEGRKRRVRVCRASTLSLCGGKSIDAQTTPCNGGFACTTPPYRLKESEGIDSGIDTETALTTASLASLDDASETSPVLANARVEWLSPDPPRPFEWSEDESGEEAPTEGSDESEVCRRLGLWSQWTACSALCGLGTRGRAPLCRCQSLGGATVRPCEGRQRAEESCAGSCLRGGGALGVWGAWVEWAACSRHCLGVRERERPCVPDSGRCEGAGTELEPCVGDCETADPDERIV